MNSSQMFSAFRRFRRRTSWHTAAGSINGTIVDPAPELLCTVFARTCEEALSRARQRDCPGIHKLAAIFGKTALYGNHIVDLHGFPAPTQSHQAVRASQFDCPVRRLVGFVI